eukprot:3017451-Prymnesium_polylepis.1
MPRWTQFVGNIYQAGLRYRKRMEQINEFSQFHALSPALRNNVQKYVDFSFAVTNGLNVESIGAGAYRLEPFECTNGLLHTMQWQCAAQMWTCTAANKTAKTSTLPAHTHTLFCSSLMNGSPRLLAASQLPPHLQLEVYLQLYRGMVQQVEIFGRCPDDFHRAVVMKMQSSICTANDYVFYEGESGERMYFIKWGKLEVLIRKISVHTFNNSGYFGEIALLADMPRTADIRALTNCLLLSLSGADLDLIFKIFPGVQETVFEAAHERLTALKKATIAKKPPSVLASLGSWAANLSVATAEVGAKVSSPPTSEQQPADATARTSSPLKRASSPLKRKTSRGPSKKEGVDVSGTPSTPGPTDASPWLDSRPRSEHRRPSLDSASIMVGPRSIGSLQRRVQQEEETEAETSKRNAAGLSALSRCARLAASIPARAIGSPTRSRSPATESVAALRRRDAIRTGSNDEQLPLLPPIVSDARGYERLARGHATNSPGAPKPAGPRSTLLLGGGVPDDIDRDDYDLPVRPLRSGCSVEAAGREIARCD